MKEIQAFVEPWRLYDVVEALQRIPGMPAIVMSEVRLFPSPYTGPSAPAGPADPTKSVEMFMIVCVVPDRLVSIVVDTMERADGNRGPGHERTLVLAVDQPVEAGVAGGGNRAP